MIAAGLRLRLGPFLSLRRSSSLICLLYIAGIRILLVIVHCKSLCHFFDDCLLELVGDNLSNLLHRQLNQAAHAVELLLMHLLDAGLEGLNDRLTVELLVRVNKVLDDKLRPLARMTNVGRDELVSVQATHHHVE